MHKFTINRKTWLRGEGDSGSVLLRPGDGKMCCLGFYLASCGVDTAALIEESTPADAAANAADEDGTLPADTAWLVIPDDNAFANSADGSLLMTANDAEEQPEREEVITALFAKHGIEVSFTDGEP